MEREGRGSQKYHGCLFTGQTMFCTYSSFLEEKTCPKLVGVKVYSNLAYKTSLWYLSPVRTVLCHAMLLTERAPELEQTSMESLPHPLRKKKTMPFPENTREKMRGKKIKCKQIRPVRVVSLQYILSICFENIIKIIKVSIKYQSIYLVSISNLPFSSPFPHSHIF